MRLDGDGAARQKTTPPAPPPPLAPASAHHLERVALGTFSVGFGRLLCAFGGRSPVPSFPWPPAPRSSSRARAPRPRGRRRGRRRRGAAGCVSATGRRDGPGAPSSRARPAARARPRPRARRRSSARGAGAARQRWATIARQLLVHVAVVAYIDLEAAILVLLEELALVNLAAAPESGFDGHARLSGAFDSSSGSLGVWGRFFDGEGAGAGARGVRRCGSGADERGGYAELAFSVVAEHAERAVVVQRRDLARVVRALSPIIRLDGGADRASASRSAPRRRAPRAPIFDTEYRRSRPRGPFR